MLEFSLDLGYVAEVRRGVWFLTLVTFVLDCWRIDGLV